MEIELINKPDYRQLPDLDQKLFCFSVIEAIKRFYDNPENEKAFQEWLAKKEKELPPVVEEGESSSANKKLHNIAPKL